MTARIRVRRSAIGTPTIRKSVARTRSSSARSTRSRGLVGVSSASSAVPPDECVLDGREPILDRFSIMIAYGHAAARSVLCGRRARELLAGRRAARRDTAGGQPPDPVAREAAWGAAPRPLRPARRADGARAPALPERVAAPRAGGAAARRARRGGGGRADGAARDRRVDGAGGTCCPSSCSSSSSVIRQCTLR